MEAALTTLKRRSKLTRLIWRPITDVAKHFKRLAGLRKPSKTTSTFCPNSQTTRISTKAWKIAAKSWSGRLRKLKWKLKRKKRVKYLLLKRKRIRLCRKRKHQLPKWLIRNLSVSRSRKTLRVKRSHKLQNPVMTLG
jgi:hypothetical protein